MSHVEEIVTVGAFCFCLRDDCYCTNRVEVGVWRPPLAKQCDDCKAGKHMVWRQRRLQ